MSLLTTLNAINQYYSFYICILIFIFGVTGNLLNILIFTQVKIFRKNRLVFYLIVESFVNIAYIILYFVSTILPTIYGYDPSRFSLFWCRLRALLLQTCSFMSVSVVCLTTFDQFCSLNTRLYLREMLTIQTSRYIIILICCIAFAHSLIYSMLNDTSPLTGCVISNAIFLFYCTIFYFPVVVGLLPIIISLSFSLLSYRSVRRIVRRQIPIMRRRFDRQMTLMIFLRVGFFCVFRFPFVIYRIYSINSYASQSNPLQFSIETMILTIFNSFIGLNYSVIFYVFILMSSRYRHQVKRFLTKQLWQELKLCCYVNRNRVAPIAIDLNVSNVESN